jgi:D-3-phosphoglycerate dehydrogenase
MPEPRAASRKPRLLVFNDGYSFQDLQDIPHEHLDVTCVPDGTREQLLQFIPDFDAYLCSLRIPMDEAIIRRAAKLRLIASPSTGTDHLSLDVIKARGIDVISIKHERALLDQLSATAELAFGLLLTCARHLPLCFEAARAGRWERHQLSGAQLRGKTLGIVGLGRLGSMMARYGLAFGMRVIASEPDPARIMDGVERVDLDSLLTQVDFVSLHVHLSPTTRGLLSAQALARMKRGSVLINTSRGALIDEAALIREMESGRIVAAGLDVIDGEWMDNKLDHPLIAYSRQNPRLYITPHVGGTCPEAVRQVARFIFEKTIRYFDPAAGAGRGPNQTST